LFDTCSEAKQAVSKHSRTSPEQNADLLLVVAYDIMLNSHFGTPIWRKYVWPPPGASLFLLNLAQVCFWQVFPSGASMVCPIWRKFVFGASVPNTIIKPKRKLCGITCCRSKSTGLQPDLKNEIFLYLRKHC
jgi:hypothetical protein